MQCNYISFILTVTEMWNQFCSFFKLQFLLSISIETDYKASQRFGLHYYRRGVAFIVFLLCVLKPADNACLELVLLHTCLSESAHMHVRELEGKTEGEIL